MKLFFKNTTSLFLSFIVMFSTMSLTINAHYCGDSLVDFTLFTKAKSCGINMHNNEDAMSILKNLCCNDQQIILEGQDELNVFINTLSYDQQMFVASFVYSYINLFEGSDINITPFKHYTPPLIVKDLQLLDEVYLI
jgi:hypothetical protein